MINFILKNKYIRLLNEEKPFTFFVFYQNPKFFNPITFYVESINPNHKFIVYARKKGFTDYGFIRIALIKR